MGTPVISSILSQPNLPTVIILKAKSISLARHIITEDTNHNDTDVLHGLNIPPLRPKFPLDWKKDCKILPN